MVMAHLFMYLTLCLSSTLLWYHEMVVAVNEMMRQVNRAECPSTANVDWGLITNRGAAHFRSIRTCKNSRSDEFFQMLSAGLLIQSQAN